MAIEVLRVPGRHNLVSINCGLNIAIFGKLIVALCYRFCESFKNAPAKQFKGGRVVLGSRLQRSSPWLKLAGPSARRPGVRTKHGGGRSGQGKAFGPCASIGKHCKFTDWANLPSKACHSLSKRDTLRIMTAIFSISAPLCKSFSYLLLNWIKRSHMC